MRLDHRVLLVAGLVAIVVGCACSSDSTDEGDHLPPIEALYPDTFFYRGSDEASWHTAVAVTLRNISDVPVVVDSIDFLDNDGLEIGAPKIIGPSSPSLTLNVFPGDPPFDVLTKAPVLREPPRRFSDYEIPPALPKGSLTTPPPGDGLIADQANDASIIVPIRLVRAGTAGSIKGLRVGYQVPGQRTTHVTYPDIEFGIVPEVDLNAGRSSRSERGLER